MNTPEQEPQFIDTHSAEMEERWWTEGKAYRRKIEPIRHAEQVTTPRTVETKLKDGTVESDVEAKVGDWIVTGSKGEPFVLTNEKFQSLYVTDAAGRHVPRERRILALPNLWGRPISILAPWSKPDKPEYQYGSEKAMLVIALDEQGHLTNDRYIIGDEEMLLNNYEPASSADIPES